MLKPLLPPRIARKEYRPAGLGCASYRGIRAGDTVRVPMVAGVPSSLRSTTGRVERLGRMAIGGPVMAWLVGGGEPVEADAVRKVGR